MSSEHLFIIRIEITIYPKALLAFVLVDDSELLSPKGSSVIFDGGG
jgi:hypothetical protein